jgi:hypothetical protein
MAQSRRARHFQETVGADTPQAICALWRNGLFNEELLFDWLRIAGPWERIKGFALAQSKAADNDSIYELFEAMAEARKTATAKAPVGAAAR